MRRRLQPPYSLLPHGFKPRTAGLMSSQTCSSCPNSGRGWLPLPKQRSVTQSSRESAMLLRWKRKWKLSASLPPLGHPCRRSTPKWLPHHLSNALSTGRAKRPFVRLPGPNRLNRLSPFRGLHLRSILHLTRANRLPRRCVILRDL